MVTNFFIRLCPNCFQEDETIALYYYLKLHSDKEDSIFFINQFNIEVKNKELKNILSLFNNKTNYNVAMSFYSHEVPSLHLLYNYKKILSECKTGLLIPKIKIKYTESLKTIDNKEFSIKKFITNKVYPINNAENFFNKPINDISPSNSCLSWMKVFKPIYYLDGFNILTNPTCLVFDISKICTCSFDNDDYYEQKR